MSFLETALWYQILVHDSGLHWDPLLHSGGGIRYWSVVLESNSKFRFEIPSWTPNAVCMNLSQIRVNAIDLSLWSSRHTMSIEASHPRNQCFSSEKENHFDFAALAALTTCDAYVYLCPAFQSLLHGIRTDLLGEIRLIFVPIVMVIHMFVRRSKSQFNT